MAASFVIPADYGGSIKVKKITSSGLVLTATAVGSSGFTLPTGAVVVGGWIDVRVAETNSIKTANIGPTGAVTGFASGIDVSAVTQVKLGGTFPYMNAGGKEIIINSVTNAHATAVFDLYLEYLEQ